jgi:hypothetical protein
MVMTVFACLMAKDYVPSMDSKKAWTNAEDIFVEQNNIFINQFWVKSKEPSNFKQLNGRTLLQRRTY